MVIIRYNQTQSFSPTSQHDAALNPHGAFNFYHVCAQFRNTYPIESTICLIFLTRARKQIKLVYAYRLLRMAL